MTDLRGLGRKILKLRLAQKVINEFYKKGAFKIPIHLAMGHESIAVAIDSATRPGDHIVATHRNVHYNFLRLSSVRALLNEYNLVAPSVSSQNRGSMNLDNPGKGITYSSSILGNNLPVGSGIALGEKIKKTGAIPFIISGDGAIEEGAFYESLLFLKSYQCPAVVVVENNGWSLGTSISERRCSIDLASLTQSLDIQYTLLEGNNVVNYVEILEQRRQEALRLGAPVLVEVKLTTLGHWVLKNDEHKNGKYINYHAGPAQTVDVKVPFAIEESEDDPVFVTKNLFSDADWASLQNEVRAEVEREGLI